MVGTVQLDDAIVRWLARIGQPVPSSQALQILLRILQWYPWAWTAAGLECAVFGTAVQDSKRRLTSSSNMCVPKNSISPVQHVPSNKDQDDFHRLMNSNPRQCLAQVQGRGFVSSGLWSSHAGWLHPE